MKLEQLIPVSGQRRLILGLIGFRRDGWEWVLGTEHINEEMLDSMDDAEWQRYMAKWVASAVSAN
jgi:hypothetical protein